MADALTTLLGLIPGIARAGFDMAQTSDAAKRNAQLVEFQNAIIQFNTLLASIQNENAFLARDKRALEDQIASMKNWDAEKQRYQLVMPYTGCTVYAVKETMSNGEAPHYLCANCFQKGERSFLQSIHPRGTTIHFTCSSCKSEMNTGSHEIGPAVYAAQVTIK